MDFVEDVKFGRLQIKAHPSKQIHAKFYLFLPENYSEHSSGFVIAGSSNFTASGLGIDAKSNYELDIELRGYEDVKFYQR